MLEVGVVPPMGLLPPELLLLLLLLSPSVELLAGTVEDPQPVSRPMTRPANINRMDMLVL